jgi:tetratricopeptide (TPR) repeat protein
MVLLNGLGDSLTSQGHFVDAQKAYEDGLEVTKKVNNLRGQGVTLAQLGKLALHQRNYVLAQQRYKEAIQLFQPLGEKIIEATCYHQLGVISERQRHWSSADQYYRQSLVLREHLNDETGAAQTCNQLAVVAYSDGRPIEAESWFQRALKYAHVLPDLGATVLNNLATFLKNEIQAGRQPRERLIDARILAQQALKITETIEASTEVVWNTPLTLAQIAELDGSVEEARTYSRRARETFAQFAGNRWHIDQQHGRLITDIANTVLGNQQARTSIEHALPHFEKNGWQIAEATRRIWAGERDWHSLCQNSDLNSALLVLRVLEEIEKGVKTPNSDDSISSTNGLPDDLRAAMARGDQEEGQRIFDALPEAEQQRVLAIMQKQITPEQLIAQLPSALQEAMQRQDVTAFQQALAALPEAEQQRVQAIMQALQELSQDDEESENAPDPEKQAQFDSLPEAVRAAVSAGDQAGFDAALAELPDEERARVVHVLQTLGILE